MTMTKAERQAYETEKTARRRELDAAQAGWMRELALLVKAQAGKAEKLVITATYFKGLRKPLKRLDKSGLVLCWRLLKKASTVHAEYDAKTQPLEKTCTSLPDLSGWQANPAENVTFVTSRLDYKRVASSLPRDCPDAGIWQTGRSRAIRGPVYEKKTGGLMPYQLTKKSGAKSKALVFLEEQEKEEKLYRGQTTTGGVIKRSKA